MHRETWGIPLASLLRDDRGQSASMCDVKDQRLREAQPTCSSVLLLYPVRLPLIAGIPIGFRVSSLPDHFLPSLSIAARMWSVRSTSGQLVSQHAVDNRHVSFRQG